MRFRWARDTTFRRVVLDVEQDRCAHCGSRLYICDHRIRRIYTLQGPLELCCRLAHCSDPACPSRPHTPPRPPPPSAWGGVRPLPPFLPPPPPPLPPPPGSAPTPRDDLLDIYAIRLSPDAISAYIRRYQSMVAARQRDPSQLRLAY